MKKYICSLFRKKMTALSFVIVTLLSVISAHAAAVLGVEPITWNIIGLDSNNVSVGPNRFPVGVRIRNTGDVAAANVAVTFVWDDGQGMYTDSPSADPYINLRPGTLSVINTASDGSPLSIAAGAYFDAYFEAEVTRNSNAYDQIRRYHVAVTADGPISASSPTPRELYVEHLISQSRNSVLDVKLDGVSIPAGGTMNLMVGEEYTITVNGATATQGYNQLEEFISLPNTIFQVLSVSTQYSANTGLESNPNNKLYGDACGWENDPNSPNYRSCVVGDGKNGGTVDVTYQVKILSVPGAPLVNPEPMTTLVHDFSGSSFHYNADYGVTARFAMIYGPSSVTINKSFAPLTIAPNATSVMKITVVNPTPETITGIQFSDPFPSGMKVAGTPGVSITGFSAGGFSPVLAGNETTINFAGGTLAPGATGTITLNVTADETAASYLNTTNHLYINTTTDTGNTASATLYVTSAPPAPTSCATKVNLATWNMPPAPAQGSGGPPPPYTTQRTGVTATAAYSAGGGGAGTASQTIVASPTPGTTNGWEILWNSSTGDTPIVSPAPDINTTTIVAPYIDLTVQYPVRKYGDVAINFSVYLNNTGWASPNNSLYVYSRADGGTFGNGTIVTVGKNGWTTVPAITAIATGSTSTTFRIFVYGMTKNKASTWLVDDITIAGCEALDPPIITKVFQTKPIKQGAASTLRFTITNPNTGSGLSGIAFTDVLPAGLSVADGSSSTCGGGTLATAAATRTIAVTGASLAAGSSCTVDVTVTGSVAGNYTNISGNVSASESGTNTTSTGYATDTIQVIAPPTFLKSFSPGSIFTNGTSTLTFSLTNPNPATPLTDVALTDNLPSGLEVAATPNITDPCGLGVITATAGSGSITLTGATLAAGTTCSFSVDVTGTTAGTKNNSTFVSSTNGGDSNTSAASLFVVDQSPAIDLTKQISADSDSGPWSKYTAVLPNGNVWYRFKVYNGGDVPFTALSIADDQFTPGCDFSASLPLAPGDEATCVYGPVTATEVTLTNTAHVTGTYGGGTLDSENSSATYARASLLLVKTAAETYYTAAGDVLHYSYVVRNDGDASLEGPVTITDNLIATVTCPDVSTVGDFDNYLDPGESITCTATYAIAGGDVGAGKSVTNTAHATVEGVDSNEDSATVPWKYLDLTVAKTNNTGGGCTNGSTFKWTLTIRNTGEVGAIFADNQVIVRDPLPAGAAYPNPPAAGNFTNINNSGNIDCAIDVGNVLTCTASGASVTIGAGGSFTVSFDVTTTATGNLANTATVDPNDEISETNETNNTGSNTVLVSSQQPPVISWDPNNSGGGLDDEGFETTFTEHGAAQAVGDVDASVADTDDTAMSILTLTTGNIADGAAEIFSIGGTAFPQDGDKTANVTLGGTTFHVVFIAGTGTFTITKDGSGDMPITDMNTLLRSILYQNTAATPTYGNRTLSAKTNDGIDDSNTAVAKIMVAKVPTLAVIGDFGAFSDGGKVVVRWQTVSEYGTVGFFLYRLNEKAGKYEKVNHKLLPGLIDSPAGGNYSYEDRSAKTGAYYTYYLEEVESSGQRSTYGPWQVFTGTPLPGEDAGMNLAAHETVTGYRLAEQPVSEDKLARLTKGMIARLKAHGARLAIQGKQAKIYVADDGMYFIDAGDIARVLGITLDEVTRQIRSNNMRLRCLGEPVAVLRAAGNSGLYFYGEKRKTQYSDENVYWLDINKGVQMQTVNRTPKKPAEDFQYFSESVWEEQDLKSLTNLFSDPGDDFWMWGMVFPGFGIDEMKIPVNTPGIVGADNATLTVALQGATDVFDGNDHHAVIRVNGMEVGETVWDGLNAESISVPVAAAALIDGENLVEITGIRNPDVDYNYFYINYLQLVYPRSYTAHGNHLTAENTGYQTICMNGFTNSDIRVFDITNPARPDALSRCAVEPSKNGSSDYQISFQAGSALRKYLALTSDQIKPCTLIADQPSHLRTQDNQGDYIIIATSDMIAAAHTLADYRASKGHVCKVVDVEDIYDEFTYGLPAATAIRDFLAYAYTTWRIPPKYVVLAGDGSFDYKNHKGFGDSVIPALLASNPDDGLRVTDNLYADVVGNDLIPEFAIGRIPAISADELLNYVNKIIGYEAAFGSWTSQTVLAADAPDAGGDFPFGSEEVAKLFSGDYLLTRLYLNSLLIKTARTNLVSAINSGSAYVNFIGHGTMFQIGKNNLFSSSDLSKLTNAMKLPVFTAMTCVAGDFGYPGYDGLNESLVLKQGGGAIAVWAPSGFAYNERSVEMCKGFYSAVFIGGETVIGDAVRRSKEAYASQGEDLQHLNLYNLVGDPALILK